MTGLEISELYYRTYVRPMLEEQFPDELDRIAAGLAGSGSECFGFDDNLSQDHDFGPGVCLWLTRADYDRFGERLQAAYDTLPTSIPECSLSPVCPERNSRVGVICIEDFYRANLGRETAPQTNLEWLRIPETFLATASNGVVFTDPLGTFSATRHRILEFYPDDVLKKKLAAYLHAMGQAGQYNFGRCLARKDFSAAYLSQAEFVNSAMAALYLLNKRYMPFYKWVFRGAQDFECLSKAVEVLVAIATMTPKTDGDMLGFLIEDVCIKIGEEVARRGWSDLNDAFMLYHARNITTTIEDADVRRLPIPYGGK